MLGATVFSFFALAHWCIALAALGLTNELLLPAFCLFVVEAVTAFDNGATVLGRRLGLGLAAEQLNRWRFLLHAICIGFLMPVYSAIGREVAFSPFGAVVGDIIGWLLVAAIAALGYLFQYKRLKQIIPVNTLGCLRYAQSVSDATRWPGYDYSDRQLNAKAIPPFASIITVIIGLVYALLIAWFGDFWVPLLVTVIMLAAGSFPQRGWGPIVTSILEVVYSSGMLYSLWYAANFS